ncbi:AAA family ATPase [Aestuariivivens insulae]|uniref:AAA family ATPase n=1 Tax=Aestuariivivens insulae TaxID=1621988 RepID=UPI001F55EB44|nr:ATP-binding protein [Aestuariivivens insulae]
MYIRNLSIKNFKSFKNFSNVKFLYPEISSGRLKNSFDKEKVKYDNINVILGNNSTGKTAFLKAIALSTLGPAVTDLKDTIRPFMWVRRPLNKNEHFSHIDAYFESNPQDEAPFEHIESSIRLEVVEKFKDKISWDHPQRKQWHPSLGSNPAAAFIVGYGASRTVELPEKFDPIARKGGRYIRINRVRSLFEETYQLIPLDAWLPKMKTDNPGRYIQILGLLAKITGDDHFKLTEQLEDDQYIFEKDGSKIPFNALSDGYRAFLGWVGDLLFHIEQTCPSGKKLVDNQGIVLIDEIDLHLHPEWQMKILPLLAEALPNIQFFVTTHSPLVVGSIEWQNIIYLKTDNNLISKPVREKRNTYGLDSDQILVSELFGLKTTRNNSVADEIRILSFKASNGDSGAREKLMELMTKGKAI